MVALVSPDGVAPSQMASVSASVNLPLHHKVQKFSSGTSSPGWSRKKGHKMVVSRQLNGKYYTQLPNQYAIRPSYCTNTITIGDKIEVNEHI